MVLDMIYVILIVCWAIIAVGFYMMDWPLISFGSLLIFILGIRITIMGIGSIQDWFTEAIGIVHIGIGAYIMIRGSYEVYKDWGN